MTHTESVQIARRIMRAERERKAACVMGDYAAAAMALTDRERWSRFLKGYYS